jgi:prevent-host-death family protein
MGTVNVYEAKSSFSKLLSRAESGETITIARNGHPVAQVGPVRTPDRPVVFGDLEGHVVIHEDFDDFDEQDEQDWYSA